MDASGRRWRVGLALTMLAAIALVVLGASWVPRWGEISIGMRLLAVLMMGLGGVVALGIAGLVVVALVLRRMGRALKRDAKSLAWSIRYMLRMGR